MFRQFIDTLNEFVGRWASWLSLGLVVLVGTNVFLRYVLNSPQAWAKELEWHLFSLLFLLTAGFSFKHNRHVRVDLFYEKMTAAEKRQVDRWGTLIFLLPWCLVLMYTGCNSAWDAYLVGERSAEANGLPNLWLIQFAIPVGAFLLFLQGVAVLLTPKSED